MAILNDVAKSLSVPIITVYGTDQNGNSSALGNATLKFVSPKVSDMIYEITFDGQKKAVAMEQEVVENIKNDVLTLEEYIQEDDFTELVDQTIYNIAIITHSVVDITAQWGATTQGGVGGTNNLTKQSVSGLKIKEDKTLEALIPEYYRVEAAPYYTPIKSFFNQITFHVVSGDPAVAIMGPTGSGKSEMAKHIASYFQKRGYATYVLQGDSHLLTEHLFDMMDFKADTGMMPQDGSICDFARKTSELGLKGIVIIDEWGAMKDATRRPFYPLFSRHNRRYVPQITKDGFHLKPVDFSHIQFLLTANPPHVQYLTDDLRPMTCAEARRVTCVEMPYESDKDELISIFKNIVRGTPNYEKVKADHVGKPPEDEVHWNGAVKLFLALNEDTDSPIRYDVSYEQVAIAYWNASIFDKLIGSKTKNILLEQLHSTIFNGISDQNTREDLIGRVAQQGIGI